ncbi:DUF6263 family protein [Kordia zhangzhouensis]|uniref:DUF6263 family protein n=1 Tax=Kordia zhangzhouensis TaxID=1620405 RepID=UPI0006290B60|nr:DUF6263 family protein [Kordia zhangzhouensis]
MITKVIRTVILVLFLTSCSKNSNKVSSSLNYEKGFTQTLVYETKTSANEMGSFQESNEIQFTLDSITKDSNYVFTGVLKRIKYESDMFGSQEGFDTEVIKSISTKKLKESELEMYNEVKDYLDEEFTLLTDKYGKTIKEAAFKNAPYRNASIVSQFSASPITFPKEPLTVGTTWNYETENPLLPSQKMVFKYTVDDITADKIMIDVAMTIDGIGGMLKATTANGTYEIDRTSKRFLSGERKMKLQTGGGTATYKVYEKK